MSTRRKRQIYDVDDDDFQKFNSLARRNGITQGEYFGGLVHRAWDEMVVWELGLKEQAREKAEGIDAVESKP